LQRLDDISISRKLVRGDFYLETVSRNGTKAIYVSRSGTPKIVLFGSPIYCQDNLFIQSPDNSIILNAAEGAKYVSLIRKHPKGHGPLGAPLKASFLLEDIIRALSEAPAVKKPIKKRPGLGAAYADTIAILQQMVEKGAVKATFHSGPAPKVDLIVKKSGEPGR